MPKISTQGCEIILYDKHAHYKPTTIKKAKRFYRHRVRQKAGKHLHNIQTDFNSGRDPDYDKLIIAVGH